MWRMYFLCTLVLPSIMFLNTGGPIAPAAELHDKRETFLEVLDLVQEAREAVANGQLGTAYNLAKAAYLSKPDNKLVFNEVWKIFIICEEHMDAYEIAEEYYNTLKNGNKKGNLIKDYYFAQYRFWLSKTIVLLHERKYKFVNFSSCKSNLEKSLKYNVEHSFLDINDVIELNNLLGVLNVLAQGKCTKNHHDIRHTHVDHKILQTAYNYFSLADSINMFFDKGYEVVQQNIDTALNWTEGFFFGELKYQKRNKIPTFNQALGIKDYEEAEVASIFASGLKDSISAKYAKPSQIVPCLSEIAASLEKYEEYHFVFDHSGSMESVAAEEGPLAGRSRMDVMKQAANYLILDLVEKDEYDLEAISVGSDCTTKPVINTYIDNSDPKKPEDKIYNMLDWLNGAKPYGATPLFEVFQALTEGIKPSKKRKVLVVFSDGVNSCEVDDSHRSDNDRLLQVKDELNKLNVEVIVISLVPEEGYAEEYSIYRELTKSSQQIWQLTDDCEEVEMDEYEFQLSFRLPPMFESVSHTGSSDSLRYNWKHLEDCLVVNYGFDEEGE